jgi:hypothetical protein
MPFPLEDTQAYLAASDQMIIAGHSLGGARQRHDVLRHERKTPRKNFDGKQTNRRLQWIRRRSIRPGTDGIKDHSMEKYVELLEKNLS